ncbi:MULTISPECIES: hypothetical protein [Synechococcales]|nr:MULTISPECIES: hypothetical protein [Synechococcales]
MKAIFLLVPVKAALALALAIGMTVVIAMVFGELKEDEQRHLE